MIYLILSILSSTVIVIVFKIQSKINIKLFPVIVINYFTATFLGLILNQQQISFQQIASSSWIYGALIIGVLLIIGFYLIGYSTQKIGIAITTVTNKMSVVLPMLFSMFFYAESISFLKLIGIILALLAMFLSVYRKRTKDFDIKYVYLPVLLFFTIGLIDSVVKYGQANLTDSEVPVFTAISFGIAGIVGIISAVFNTTKFKDFLNIKILVTGIIIGSANFGSMYFLIYALEKSGFDSSVVFGVNNIGIIALSVLSAFFIFKEKFKIVNWFGILLSLIAIALLTGFYKIIFV